MSLCFQLRRAVLLFLPLLLLAVGCASAGKPKLQTATSGPEQRFTMTGSGFQTTALITRDGAQGPQIDVGRYDEGKTIRGKASGQVTDLTVSGTRAQGIWGQGPLTLDVAEEGDQLKINGLVAGRPSNWTVSAERIEGHIGFCAYDLGRSGDSYAGSRSCAGGISSVNVQFPSTILEWQPINVAILMALLMSTP
ncbi:MAG TPA: hypothetical protein VMT11_18835 [Myxococcaceae bacterium]|nr:hypothetical protein [Myxococcaceae bacterium]